MFRTFTLALALLFSTISLNAQSLGDLFSSGNVKDAVSSVTGGLTVSADKIIGEWKYVKPAVELNSDNISSTAAGSLVASQIENKLDTYCAKVGIKKGVFAFVFNTDNTFTSNIGNRKLSGTYTVDSENGTITLTYGSLKIGKLTTKATLTSTSLSLLFKADKLLSLLATISSSSSNEELKLLGSLAQKYNGLNIGFELSGKAVQTTESKVEQAGSVIDAISKWF